MNQKRLVTILIIVGVIVIVGIAVFLVTRFVPTLIPGLGTKTVSLGEEFLLKKGQTAQLQGLDVSLTVTGFINSPCPAGTQCFWSGQAVSYKLKADGQTYTASAGHLPPGAPYDVKITKSDYQTYATFFISKSENSRINF